MFAAVKVVHVEPNRNANPETRLKGCRLSGGLALRGGETITCPLSRFLTAAVEKNTGRFGESSQIGTTKELYN